ncbi:MAG TPA: M15 family metallopeptidase [Longimicrobium sp.]|nr:M15 family metallopeptidase [Longimicrobium sp.]
MSSSRSAKTLAGTLLAAWLTACSARAASPAASASPAATPAPAAAQACAIPAGAQLTNVQAADPSIRTDVRYATANNFTGERLPGYDRPLALLRPEAARALARVQARLRADGLGLKVFDGYRPVRATLAMVDWAERTNRRWVLDQGYVARSSGHNRGHTVDLTLVRLDTGEELDMGTPYDTFSEAAHTANATGAVRTNRGKLVGAMNAEGFVNYSKEWWHFSLPGQYPPLDVPLGCFR